MACFFINLFYKMVPTHVTYIIQLIHQYFITYISLFLFTGIGPNDCCAQPWYDSYITTKELTNHYESEVMIPTVCKLCLFSVLWRCILVTNSSWPWIILANYLFQMVVVFRTGLSLSLDKTTVTATFKKCCFLILTLKHHAIKYFTVLNNPRCFIFVWLTFRFNFFNLKQKLDFSFFLLSVRLTAFTQMITFHVHSMSVLTSIIVINKYHFLTLIHVFTNIIVHK